MAIDDFGGEVLGKKIELVIIVRPEQGRHCLVQGTRVGGPAERDGCRSAVPPRPSRWPRPSRLRKQIPFFSVGAATARLTNEDCTPDTIHYGFDTVSGWPA